MLYCFNHSNYNSGFELKIQNLFIVRGCIDDDVLM